MNIGNQIKQIADKRQISKEEIAEYLGITVDAVYKIYKQAHINTERLEQFSKLFNVPITAFLDESNGISVNGDSNTTLSVGRDLKNVGIDKKNDAAVSDCERLLAEKERVIQLQQKLIEKLERDGK